MTCGRAFARLLSSRDAARRVPSHRSVLAAARAAFRVSGQAACDARTAEASGANCGTRTLAWRVSKSGLGFRLSNADPEPAPRPKLARATALDETTTALLARLPAMQRAAQEKPFNLRDRSPPAPRPGETLKTPFPPAASAPPPPPTHSAGASLVRFAPEGDVDSRTEFEPHLFRTNGRGDVAQRARGACGSPRPADSRAARSLALGRDADAAVRAQRRAFSESDRLHRRGPGDGAFGVGSPPRQSDEVQLSAPRPAGRTLSSGVLSPDSSSSRFFSRVSTRRSISRPCFRRSRSSRKVDSRQPPASRCVLRARGNRSRLANSPAGAELRRRPLRRVSGSEAAAEGQRARSRFQARLAERRGSQTYRRRPALRRAHLRLDAAEPRRLRMVPGLSATRRVAPQVFQSDRRFQIRQVAGASRPRAREHARRREP